MASEGDAATLPVAERADEPSTVSVVVKVMGEPLVRLPPDLYIPPDALEIVLEAFEGPLDLLLYLIRRQNLDILDVPIAEITRQYMRYVELMQGLRLELAAEYLVMAAVLAHIKSRMLLPQPSDEAPEEADPRLELARRLQVYEQFKEAAQTLDELPRLERNVYPTRVSTPPVRGAERSEPTVDLGELVMAFADVMARAERFAHHAVQREALSVRQRMVDILARLECVRFSAFTELFPVSEGRPGVTVTFLAILELFRERLVELRQAEAFAPIYVRAATASTARASESDNAQGKNEP